MPNWVYNTLHITGKPARVTEIKDKAYFNGLIFNFRAFVPHPNGASTANHENFDLKDWMIEHWGTYNAVDSKIVVDEPGSVSYLFSTEWEPPVKLVSALEKLYPDVEFFLDYVREIDDESFVDDSPKGLVASADDGLDFVEWLESSSRDDALSKKTEFSNIIIMDDENIEKFKKIYGEGKRLGETVIENIVSFSMIIPGPAKDDSDKNWADNSKQSIWSFRHYADRIEDKMPDPVIGRELEIWRYDNWGTSSDLLYDSYMPNVQSLDGLLKGEYEFYTLCQPPINVYKKMASDGLIFKVTWSSDAADEWTTGCGVVEEGNFQYHNGPITGDEKVQLNLVVHDFFYLEESSNYRSTIGVKSREHLDQLIKHLQYHIKSQLDLLGTSDLIENVAGNTVGLRPILDLNFFSISSEITDLSNLFADFDVSPSSEGIGFCKIKVDVSRWDVSNVTKMANLFDRERVELIGLNRWDRSKVTDC